jgi:hypothetical protein
MEKNDTTISAKCTSDLTARFCATLGGTPVPLDLIQLVLFLTDWRSCLAGQGALVSNYWRNTTLGPSLPELDELLRRDGRFILLEKVRKDKEEPRQLLIKLTPIAYFKLYGSSLTRAQKDVLDAVIEMFHSSSSMEFVDFLCSSYPMVTTPPGESMELMTLLAQYHALKQAKKPSLALT